MIGCQRHLLCVRDFAVEIINSLEGMKFKSARAKPLTKWPNRFVLSQTNWKNVNTTNATCIGRTVKQHLANRSVSSNSAALNTGTVVCSCVSQLSPYRHRCRRHRPLRTKWSLLRALEIQRHLEMRIIFNLIAKKKKCLFIKLMANDVEHYTRTIRFASACRATAVECASDVNLIIQLACEKLYIYLSFSVPVSTVSVVAVCACECVCALIALKWFCVYVLRNGTRDDKNEECVLETNRRMCRRHRSISKAKRSKRNGMKIRDLFTLGVARFVNVFSCRRRANYSKISMLENH